jgi:IS5 family transposase
MRQADVENGVKSGTTAAEDTKLREARQRIRLQEQRTRSSAERPRISRRPTCRERLYPLVKEVAAGGISVAVTCRVLRLARQPY